jgi:hypothetical protein
MAAQFLDNRANQATRDRQSSLQRQIKVTDRASIQKWV